MAMSKTSLPPSPWSKRVAPIWSSAPTRNAIRSYPTSSYPLRLGTKGEWGTAPAANSYGAPRNAPTVLTATTTALALLAAEPARLATRPRVAAFLIAELAVTKKFGALRTGRRFAAATRIITREFKTRVAAAPSREPPVQTANARCPNPRLASPGPRSASVALTGPAAAPYPLAYKANLGKDSFQARTAAPLQQVKGSGR